MLRGGSEGESPGSESLGKVSERMLQGRSASICPWGVPTIPPRSKSRSPTSPLGLWKIPALARIGGILLGEVGRCSAGGSGGGWMKRMTAVGTAEYSQLLLSSSVLSSSLSKGSSSRSKSAKFRLCGAGLLGAGRVSPKYGAGEAWELRYAVGQLKPGSLLVGQRPAHQRGVLSSPQPIQHLLPEQQPAFHFQSPSGRLPLLEPQQLALWRVLPPTERSASLD